MQEKISSPRLTNQCCWAREKLTFSHDLQLLSQLVFWKESLGRTCGGRGVGVGAGWTESFGELSLRASQVVA